MATHDPMKAATRAAAAAFGVSNMSVTFRKEMAAKVLAGNATVQDREAYAAEVQLAGFRATRAMRVTARSVKNVSGTFAASGPDRTLLDANTVDIENKGAATSNGAKWILLVDSKSRWILVVDEESRNVFVIDRTKSSADGLAVHHMGQWRDFSRDLGRVSLANDAPARLCWFGDVIALRQRLALRDHLQCVDAAHTPTVRQHYAAVVRT